MKGRIYSEDGCPCGASLVDDGKRLICREHGHVASSKFYVKFGRAIKKRFGSYHEAERFLIGLRFKTDEGTLDARDYQASQPLNMARLVDEYLSERTKLKSYRDVERMMHSASAAMGELSIKAVQRLQIKQWLKGLKVSEKTRHNYRSAMHAFMLWAKTEGYLDQLPDIPEVEFELGWRTITDWKTQEAIVAEVSRIAPPKVHFAVELLRTYTALRPGDLARLTEADMGEVLMVWRPTKKKNNRKTIRLLEHHVAWLHELQAKYPALPATLFFRHHGGIQSVKPGQAWGEKYVYKWWVRACENLGIKDLDLYGGTRHTTTTELAKIAGRDGAKEASGHETNKAFDRYCQMQDERAFQMAKLVDHARTTVLPLRKDLSR